MSFFDIFKINKFKDQIATLQQSNNELNEKLTSLGAQDSFAVQEQIKQLKASHESMLQQFDSLSHNASELAEKNQKAEKQLATNQKKLGRIRCLYALNPSGKCQPFREPHRHITRLAQCCCP